MNTEPLSHVPRLNCSILCTICGDCRQRKDCCAQGWHILKCFYCREQTDYDETERKRNASY